MDESEAGYRELLGGIEGLCEAKLGSGGGERNRVVLETYWLIGQRLGQLAAGGNGAYGSGMIKRLAADLSARFGEGFSLSNLFSMRRFGQVYTMVDLAEPLSWSHYRLLVGLEDAEQRRALEDQVRSGELGCRDLAAALSALRLARRLSQKGEEGGALKTRAGQLGLFRLERPGSLDAGFGVKLTCPVAPGPELADRAIVRLGAAGCLEAARTKQDGERFCYQARLARVVDGDTLLLRVALGLGVELEMRFRLRGLDAAELGARAGEGLKRYLADLLPAGTPLLLYTYGSDMYGRYLADVFYLAKGTDVVDLTPGQGELIFLNEELLNSGQIGYQERLYS